MSSDEKEHLSVLEQATMEQSISIPVYFSAYNPKLEDIIVDISHTSTKKANKQFESPKTELKQRKSALKEVLDSISANGYQIIVSGASHINNKYSKIPVIQGELGATKVDKFVDGTSDTTKKLQLIIIAANLNTFGIYKDYPLNADVSVLIALADMFSKLYNTSNAALKYHILFLLTESGPLLNYQGVKKWVDENVQVQNVDFVLCLDAITQSLNANNNHMHIHVSKPPKGNTPANIFFKDLKNVAAKYSNLTIEVVHKKINLAEEQLAWLHERFSIKRLPSFTLSALKSPKDPTRTTIFKDNERSVLAQTQRNAKIIAEALARYIYTNSEAEGIEDFEIFSGAMQISSKLIKSYLNLKSALQNNDVKNAFEKYLKNVKIIYEKPDAREPDFMLYEGSDAVLNVYRIKPAVFDLFLTIIIFSYLCSVYFIIQVLPSIYQKICKMSINLSEPPPIHNILNVGRNKTKNY